MRAAVRQSFPEETILARLGQRPFRVHAGMDEQEAVGLEPVNTGLRKELPVGGRDVCQSPQPVRWGVRVEGLGAADLSPEELVFAALAGLQEHQLVVAA